MQVCEDHNGVLWINDSKATNVEAAMAGLAGLGGRKAVVLLGGLAKAGRAGEGYGFSRLVKFLDAHRAVITFGASGGDIAEELKAANPGVVLHSVSLLAEAMRLAANKAQPGDIVLLSPACASFDEFTNFEHRGKFFSEWALTQSSQPSKRQDC
eukprot:SM000016S01927  [mRNA]  locus=s16:621457:622708:- [translate_table: standard]